MTTWKYRQTARGTAFDFNTDYVLISFIFLLIIKK